MLKQSEKQNALWYFSWTSLYWITNIILYMQAAIRFFRFVPWQKTIANSFNAHIKHLESCKKYIKVSLLQKRCFYRYKLHDSTKTSSPIQAPEYFLYNHLQCSWYCLSYDLPASCCKHSTRKTSNYLGLPRNETVTCFFIPVVTDARNFACPRTQILYHL